MPEYFYHVALEYLPYPHHLSSNGPASAYAPADLSRVFDALRPFLRSTHPRTSRDTAFDRKPSTSRSQPSTAHDLPRATTVAEQVPPSKPDDHRLDLIHLECADMEATSIGGAEMSAHDQIGKGIGTSISGVQTKGKYEKLASDGSEGEWGIVHLYRDANETPGLYKNKSSVLMDAFHAGTGVPQSQPLKPNPPAKDVDCSTLCILAVPSYLSPGDFLAYVGEETREQVSHFRMIRTTRANRYMVLMKFKNGKNAREWQHEWNGKVFNSMEPETCHVVFLKSVEIMQPALLDGANTSSLDGSSTFPRMSNDPFAGTPKPLAPRTPSLVELPTCPVCLERMDETTGLLTILCQHVFHCTCLEKWSGGGCPVCRYTHDDFSTGTVTHKSKSKLFSLDHGPSGMPLECETCHADTSLWQCIICGTVGCGRYEGKHAFKHFEETGHNFSIDLESKRVWDYAADVYVHRIIQDAAKPGEKLLELPGRRRDNNPTALDPDDDIEGAKMENVALEYTHLLTSQLESQRVYFEDVVQRTTDKAREATQSADRAVRDCDELRERFQRLMVEHNELLGSALPDLEGEKKRLEKRSAKFEDMAKSINSKYLEEKSLASSLMERIKHLEESKLAQLEQRVRELEEDNATKELLMEGLRDEHRDAMMQISAQRKLREMVERGELDEEDLEGATIEAGPAARSYGRKSTKSRGKAKSNGTTRPADHVAPDDVLMQLIQGSERRTVQKSEKWDDASTSRILDDFRAKLVEQGLLVEVNDGSNGRADDEDVHVDGDHGDGEENETQDGTKATTKAKKKRKAKKK